MVTGILYTATALATTAHSLSRQISRPDHERTDPDTASRSPPDTTLNAQCHDTIHNVIVILLERFDGFFPTDARLRHDKFDVFALETRVVDFFAVVVLVVIRLSFLVFDGFAFALPGAGVGVAGAGVGGAVGVVGGGARGGVCVGAGGGGGFLRG